MSSSKRHQQNLDLLTKILRARTDEYVKSQYVSALLVYKNKVIAIGNNSMKTSPFQKRFSKHPLAVYNHAETQCIKNALRTITTKELEKATLYISRMSKSGRIGLSKPCEGCKSAIDFFGLKTVIYSINKDTYGSL